MTKKFIPFIVAISGILTLLSYSSIAKADSVACTTNGSGEITDPLACFSLASQMQFPVTKIALCQSKPPAPTLSTPVDISKCVTLINNPGGTPVVVRKGGVTQLPGQLNSLSTLSGGKNNGVSYSYAYIEADAYSSVQATSTFSSNRTGVENPGTPGVVCWTTDATFYSYMTGAPSAGSRCGSVASNPGITKVLLNSLGTNGAYMSYSSTSNGITTDSYLVDSSLRQAAATTAGNMGTVSKIVNIQTLPITITQQSAGIKAMVQVSQGAWILQQSSGPNLWFQNGNANLVLSSCGDNRCN